MQHYYQEHKAERIKNVLFKMTELPELEEVMLRGYPFL
jgi:hypothetical protein